MQEVKDYIEVLIESLEKKAVILDEILCQNELQAGAAGNENFDTESFERAVDAKDKLIYNLMKLDNGFETIYERVRPELQDNKEQYKEQIVRLKELVRLVSDKSASVQASELRNKRMIEEGFRNARDKIRQNRTNVKAANDYYKAMSRNNYGGSGLMDLKH